MNAAIEKALTRRPTLWAIIGVVTLQALFFWGSVVDMTALWKISVYKHCWIILPLVLLLVARKSEVVDEQPFLLNRLALCLLPVLSAVWFVGERASIRALEHIAFVAIVVISILAVIGWRKFRRLLFPMGLLFAAVPIGGFLIPTLMDWTADIAAGLLEFTGVPAWRQGALITLPNGVFHVAEVCSGISYVLASLILSLVFSYSMFASLWKRMIFVVGTVAAFIVLNGIRAYIVIIVANATQMRWFTGWDHVYFGQFLFFCLAVLLYFVGRRWADVVAERTRGQMPADTPLQRIGIYAAMTVVLTFGVLRIADYALAPTGDAPTPPASMVRVVNCGESAAWSEAFVPELSGAAASESGSYQCQDAAVGYFVAYFDDPESGSEIVNTEHKYWPDAWKQIGTRAHYAASLGMAKLDIGELSFERAGRTRLVWYVYAIGSRMTANPYTAKFWEAMYGVTGRRHAGSVSVITLEVVGDRRRAREVMEQYLAVRTGS